MTPAVSWHPSDYYRASRAARRACELTYPQLQLAGVLEAADVDGLLASASVASSTPLAREGGVVPRGGAFLTGERTLNPGAEPNYGHMGLAGPAVVASHHSVPPDRDASAPSPRGLV